MKHYKMQALQNIFILQGPDEILFAQMGSPQVI